MKAIRAILLAVLTVYYVCAAPNEYESDIEEDTFSNEEENSESSETQDGDFLSKLIGSHKVSITKFPYTAAVIQKTRHFGSAVVLNKRWLLTTAWVIYTQNPNTTIVRVGSSSAIDKGQTSWVDLNITHPDYRQTYDNDVGLIKLATPIKFNRHVKAVRIARKVPAHSVRANLAGFGVFKVQKSKNSKAVHDGWLRALSAQTISNSKCKAYFQNSTLFSSRNYCLKTPQGAGPSSYNYGSPLIYKKKLIGLYSGHPAYVDVGTPLVLTKVSLFTKWINDVIKQYSSPEELQDIYEDIEYY